MQPLDYQVFQSCIIPAKTHCPRRREMTIPASRMQSIELSRHITRETRHHAVHLVQQRPEGS